jgi:hypothetical protein
MSAEEIARMEEEMGALERDFKAVERAYGENVLDLTVCLAHVKHRLENPKAFRFLVTTQVLFAPLGRKGWPLRARLRCSSTGRPCLRRVEIVRHLTTALWWQAVNESSDSMHVPSIACTHPGVYKNATPASTERFVASCRF